MWYWKQHFILSRYRFWRIRKMWKKYQCYMIDYKTMECKIMNSFTCLKLCAYSLLVRPSRIPHRNSKIIFVLGADKSLERLESKVHIFWEGHKILRNLPLTFDRMYCSQKLGEDFAKFLWPSQNIWTLATLNIC